MKEANCDVIRDLLPLYEDGAVSEETAKLVRKHLADCPDCRAELRKMRTPISLPPDEDEKAVKRFLERRAEIRKKQNVKLACAVSVLAVIVVFCLCYTLIPRSWDTASRKAEPDRIMGHYSAMIFQPDLHVEIWQLDGEQETDPAVIGTLMDTLRAGSYRPELRNVLNYTPLGELLDTSVKGASDIAQLYLVQDNEVVATASFYNDYSHTVQVSVKGNPNTFFYHTDGAVYDALSALMMEYGILK